MKTKKNNTFQKESQIEYSPNNKSKSTDNSYNTNKTKDKFIVDWQMQEERYTYEIKILKAESFTINKSTFFI